MTAKSSAYRFGDFITDLEMITAIETMDEEKIRKIHRKMRLLLSGDEFLPEAAKKPDPRQYARHLLHEDPKKRFVVVSLVWGPRQGTPIHDHSTWGVAGILSNELRIVNYDRLDDGAKPGRAELREASSITAPTGTVIYVLPPNDEIHLLENPTETITITLHVYGKQITECNRYDLAAKTYSPWKLSYDTVDLK
ncbi:MAG TPA: cysteine dioxygenase family protein [Planctomycetota bacterium]|nr:cysteine dioxygenase family protein [Planctomycetota bacterium]